MVSQIIKPGFANNSYSVSKKHSELDEFLALKDPPEFPVIVNGRNLVGKLTGMVGNAIEWQLVVEFSDGVTDIFYIPYGTRLPWFACNKKNIAYAKAIAEKLYQLLHENMLKFGKD